MSDLDTPGLFIDRQYDRWYVILYPRVLSYDFHGYQGVRALSHAMLCGKGSVIQAIDQDLIFVKKEGDTGARLYDTFFRTAVRLLYDSSIIMSAAEGSTLDAELRAAGEALAGIVFVTAAEIALTTSAIDETERAPARHLMRNLTAASNSPDFSIGFTNNITDFTTTFSSTRVSISDHWPQRIISQPADTLDTQRHATLSIACSAKHIALGPFDTTWGWQNGNVWFAVMIHVPLQENRAGNAPFYKVSWSSPANKSVDWSRPVKDPGKSWMFPADLGWQVQVHSQAGSQTLHLTVTISDLR